MNVASPAQQLNQAQHAENAPLAIWSIITSLTSGGAESLVASLNSSFVDAGLKHTVIALCDAATLGNSRETEERIRRQIELAGGEFISLKLNRWRDPFSGGRSLRRVMQDQLPDLIHAHTARAIPMVSASRFAGPVVLTHHNSRLSFPKLFFRYIDAVVDSYVAISAETEEIYRSQCRKPVKRISNGVARSFFAGPVRQAASSPCNILSVGAVSKQKNYGLLLETARELQARATGGPVAVFRVAGGGQGLPDLRRQVEDAGLQRVVEFLGERSDIPQLLGDADVFLNTSNYEGQSVAILEAMAMALPVVATEVPGNRDLVSDEQNGLLVAHNEPEKLANAILRLTEESQLYSSLSKGARQTGQQFSAEKAAADHVELYRNLASKG